MGNKVNISAGTYLSWACMILVLPHNWVIGTLSAALVHELSHILVLHLVGGKMICFTMKALGAEIHTSELSRGQEAVCSIAGPAGSILTAFLIEHIFPEAALCALVQGLFNLIPVYPLDGGRFIYSLTSEAMAKAIQIFALVLLWGMGIWACLHLNLGILPLFPAILATRAAIPRKIPCKETNLAVQ